MRLRLREVPLPGWDALELHVSGRNLGGELVASSMTISCEADRLAFLAVRGLCIREAARKVLWFDVERYERGGFGFFGAPGPFDWWA